MKRVARRDEKRTTVREPESGDINSFAIQGKMMVNDVWNKRADKCVRLSN